MIMILCAALLLFVGAVQVTANGRGSYYGSYRTYPTGDTIIATGYNDGGSANAEEKWLVECGDAEGKVGQVRARFSGFYTGCGGCDKNSGHLPPPSGITWAI